MRLLLAPMEGLLDDVLRAVLTRPGGYDYAVSEFARVSGTLLPDRFFRRIASELDRDSFTPGGTPVRVQLLGSDPECMAANAARLARLGPAGVDLNFGCPAPTVNRHRGGAVLLDEPELLHRITRAVADALPAGLALSAKMRLGVRDPGRAAECAQALTDGGASLLVVHARTKLDGYRPPAYWDQIPIIRAAVSVPVVANGEIWTVEDAQRCRAVSGCDVLMLGRGMVADPGLARALRAADAGQPGSDTVAWAELLPHLMDFWRLVCADLEPLQRAGRLKQWLNLMRRRFPEAERAYQQVRTMTDQVAITLWLQALPTANCPAPVARAA